MNSTVKRFIHAWTSEEMDGAIHAIAILKIRSKALTPGMDWGGWYHCILQNFRTSLH